MPTIGKVVAARVVQQTDQLTIITSGGMALRLRVDGIRASGRATRGVRIMDLQGVDRVVSVARIIEEEIILSPVSDGAKTPTRSASDEPVIPDEVMSSEDLAVLEEADSIADEGFVDADIVDADIVDEDIDNADIVDEDIDNANIDNEDIGEETDPVDDE
jgi:hypothetical protein